MTSDGLRVQAYRWMMLFAVSTIFLLGAASGCRGPAIGHVSSSSPDGSGVAALLVIVLGPLWVKALTRVWPLSSALVRTGAGTDRWRVIAWYACIAVPVVSLPFAAVSEDPVWLVVVFTSAVPIWILLSVVWWALAALAECQRGGASAPGAESSNE